MVKFLIGFMLLVCPMVAHAMSDREILKAGQYHWSNEVVDGPVRVVVDLHTQMAYVYQNDAVIGVTSVSTGRDKFETSQGRFTVLYKEVNHFSKKYKADMPWTMFFNNQGEALHSGRDPGSRSSHGCVHLPDAFAAKLYTLMAVGDQVEIVAKREQFNLTL